MVAISLDLSGQTIHIRNLANGLISRGHSVAVATAHVAAGRPLGREYFDECNIPVFTIEIANFGAGLPSFAFQLFASTRSLCQVLLEFQADILHLHAITLVPQAQLATLFADIHPVVLSTFHNEQMEPNKQLLGRLACKLSGRALGERVFAISSGMAEIIAEKIGVPRETVCPIHNAADDAYFVPPSEMQRKAARERFGIAPEEVAVVCLARFEPRKNQGTLIQAVARLRRDGVAIRLLLAGDDIDSYRSLLQAIAEREGCGQYVSILDFQSDPRQLLWAADINALISVQEGFGLVVVEAAMTGVPTIRSRSAGAEDQIVDKESGILVESGDLMSVCHALRALAASQPLRRRMGQNAQRLCRSKYSISVMVRQVEDAYRQAIEDRRSIGGI